MELQVSWWSYRPAGGATDSPSNTTKVTTDEQLKVLTTSAGGASWSPSLYEERGEGGRAEQRGEKMVEGRYN